MPENPLPIPSHVPADRVIDFDLWTGPEIRRDPYLGFARLHGGPKLLFTPHNQGHWVVTNAKLAREIMTDHSRFAVDLHYNPRLDENGARMIPAQVDPPKHTRYRNIINPPLSPASVKTMDNDIRALSRELIDKVRMKGRCDFFRDIAQHFPIAIFMGMAALPFDDRFKLFDLVDMITHDSSPGAQGEGLRRLSEYLRRTVMERRENPGKDILSIIASAKIDGAFPPEDDIIYLAVNVVLGGLDTVISGLTFCISYLARNPDQYQLLVEDPKRIKKAVEEMLRVYAPAALERCVTADIEFDGVLLRKFDRIVVIPALFNTDPEMVTNPMRIDFERSHQPHMAFGAGPHHCAGAHLARLEMRTFLEEWTRAIPTFSVPSDAEFEGVGGFVMQLTSLPLEWDSSSTRAPSAEH